MDPMITFAGIDDTRSSRRQEGRSSHPRPQRAVQPAPHPGVHNGANGQIRQVVGEQYPPVSHANRGPAQASYMSNVQQTNGAAAFASAAAMAAMSFNGPAAMQAPGNTQGLSWQQQEMLNREASRQHERRPQQQHTVSQPQENGMQQHQRPASSRPAQAHAVQQGGRGQQQGGRPQSARPVQQVAAVQQQQQQQPRQQQTRQQQTLSQQQQQQPPQQQQQQSRQQQQQPKQQPKQALSQPSQQQQQQRQQNMVPVAATEAAAGGAPAASGVKPKNSTALQHQSDVRFSSLDISPLTKRAMAEVFGYEYCTKVQAQSLPACLSGQDVLAKAKTGTGKTLAFMIPAVENLLRNPPRPGQVGVLVLSPTRELAMQIHVETEKLLRFQKMSVQVVIGGTNINAETKRLQASTPQVLVATPGRCLDHLTNSTSGLGPLMRDLCMLVLDEADNILDMGFRPTIEKILALLPDKSKRQTLLFSATFPSNVRELAKYAFRPAYATIDTVGEESNTNVQVEQLSCVVPHKDIMLYLLAVIKTHMQQDAEFKVIVFFPTARMTQLYSETFLKLNMPVLEMHSRKSQAVRTRMSDEFRAGSGLIMMSSDVSARGVDYPDVSLVVQVGLPSDKDQYVHRVGRTARAGKAGQSLLLLTDFEANFLNKLKGLPIRNLGALPESMVQAGAAAMAKALSQVPADTKGKAYAAWLGFYKSAPTLNMSVGQLVETANEFSRIIGCGPEPPELEAKTVGKMGLKGVPGLRIAGKPQASRPPQQGGDRPPQQGGNRPSQQGGNRPPQQEGNRPPPQGGNRPASGVNRG